MTSIMTSQGDDKGSFSDSCGNRNDMSVVDTVNNYVGRLRATCHPTDAPTVASVGSRFRPNRA